MRRAVYYPHTQIRNEKFLKTALLLWDEVQFLSPSDQFSFEGANATEIEALEILCRPHVPTESEKTLVHRKIVDLLANPLPEWLSTKAIPKSISSGRKIKEFSGYSLYTEKLDQRTWNILEAANLLELNGPDNNHIVKPLLGFHIMSLLADACAGTKKEKITDRTDAYEFMWKISSIMQSKNSNATEYGAESLAKSDLVHMAIQTIKTEGIPLENFILMRKREAQSSGHHYQNFRKNFAEKIQQNSTLALLAKTEGERREISEDFKKEMKNDLAILQEELGYVFRGSAFSKEIIALVSLNETIPGTGPILGAVAGIIQATDKYTKAYTDTLSKHPISYLHLGERPTLRNLPFLKFQRKK